MPIISLIKLMLFSANHMPELISLHIPKTAGTSFRNILKSIYGEDQVVRFDINEIGEVRLNQLLYSDKNLPKVKVIHGHFVIGSFKNKFQLATECKMITWVRDPVKRVLSNFFYLESRLQELLNEEKNNLNILSKMQRTLIEYARADINRNRQSKFFSGSKPEDYHFIGIHEFFDQEILRLSSILKWNGVPEVLHHNKTPETRSFISDEVINEIRSLNMEDVQLYKTALQIRNEHLNL